MPTIPQLAKLNATSVDIINTIRASANADYQAAVGIVTHGDVLTLHAVGDNIMALPDRENEFVSTLFNRIGETVIRSRAFHNRLRGFKKGLLGAGESIQEIFIALATPHEYDAEDSETTLLARTIPDVSQAFHAINYKKIYTATIQKQTLKQAFASFDGLTNMISGVIEKLSTSYEFDEFLVTKYLISRLILDGFVAGVAIGEVTAARSNEIVSTMKEHSNNMGFMRNDYNAKGVYNHCEPKDQRLITTSKFDSIYTVESLATAFNVEHRLFEAQSVVIDTFGSNDAARLALLFAGDASYVPFTVAELAQLAKVQALLVDENFLMIYDDLMEVNEFYNPKGLYYNTFLHAWKIFSASPFAPACYFTTELPVVTP